MSEVAPTAAQVAQTTVTHVESWTLTCNHTAVMASAPYYADSLSVVVSSDITRKTGLSIARQLSDGDIAQGFHLQSSFASQMPRQE